MLNTHYFFSRFWLIWGLTTPLAYAIAPVVDLNQETTGTSYSYDDTSSTPETITYPPTMDPLADNPAPTNIEASDESENTSLPSRENLPSEVRLRLLEQQINNLIQMNLSAKIDQLQQQIQQLTGQLELQQHHINLLTERQRTFSQTAAQQTGQSTSTEAKESNPNNPSRNPDKTNLANKITQAESGITKTETTSTETTQSANSSEETAYQSAFNLVANKQDAAAISALQQFLRTYPKGTYTPNAHYWLGELYYTTNKPTLALEEFKTLIQQYPTAQKIPDALLKIALIHDSQGLHSQSKQELQQITQQYQGTAAARLANLHLKQVEPSGYPTNRP